jgi:hypothetical protein
VASVQPGTLLVRLRELRRFEHAIRTIHGGRVRSIGKWLDGAGMSECIGRMHDQSVFLHF